VRAGDYAQHKRKQTHLHPEWPLCANHFRLIYASCWPQKPPHGGRRAPTARYGPPATVVAVGDSFIYNTSATLGPTNILASEQSFAACGKLPFPTWSPANDGKFSGATPNKFLMRLQAYGRDYAFAA
jgi:hypothetical protein